MLLYWASSPSSTDIAIAGIIMHASHFVLRRIITNAKNVDLKIKKLKKDKIIL